LFTFVCSCVSDILDYSKIDAGLLQLDLVPTPLLEALETAVMLCEDAAASSGLDLLYQVQSEACATFAIDATRLQQILLNLLSNVRNSGGGDHAAQHTRGHRHLLTLLLVLCLFLCLSPSLRLSNSRALVPCPCACAATN
jgi:signal transduction histidine kinase